MATQTAFRTTILPVDASKIGKLTSVPRPDDLLDDLKIELDDTSIDAQYLLRASVELRTSDIPVAFPTETVYGLGADATRSSAVQGIYRAKQRPSDNPLIVHFASLDQLRKLLRPGQTNLATVNGITSGDDPIPSIYGPLIKRFWPGPLTIILPNPVDTLLAPEVTAGLSTFGARIPAHPLALALIKLAEIPIAAPSANASTKPSPTAAEHVHFDLNGRIRTILDGGPCSVGVESTVVDGLSDPPSILRPGGISLEQLRLCPGWGNLQIGYKNAAETGSQPKAPGMKYRHYSPKAPVVLFECDTTAITTQELVHFLDANKRLGLVRTKFWTLDVEKGGNSLISKDITKYNGDKVFSCDEDEHNNGVAGLISTLKTSPTPRHAMQKHTIATPEFSSFELIDLNIGPSTKNVARGIFAALRELDREDVDAILVEGIDDSEGSVAAAVMNRLRKAAEVRR
ncbi:hypothetical protein LTR62_002398 [Meristemomyces frigidus]|uniref:Threonylcarbamoyl-AMP synthase n=1 Tax=Meristemomyces frigidus TaxID=1508187 RepID=A0AAN7TKW2_9PEZI|nr:hypothetical protein LTR62_002398 [Meristemomyces frigidus]